MNPIALQALQDARRRLVRASPEPSRRFWTDAEVSRLQDLYLVVFKDRNPQHIELDNLELVSRAENMRRNTIHRYPPELKSTIRQLSKLKRAISEAASEKQDD